MAKSLKTCNGSRKSLRKGRKSLRKGRKSVKRGKGFRKMYGGTKLTDLLIKYENKKLGKEEQEELSTYLNDKSLINATHRQAPYFGFSPLHILCSQGTLNVPVVKKLIENGADVNATSQYNNDLTPLDVLIDYQEIKQWRDNHEFKKIMTLLLEHNGLYHEKIIVKDVLNKNYKKLYIEGIMLNLKKTGLMIPSKSLYPSSALGLYSESD